MGWDCNGFVEVKTKGRWEVYDSFSIDRNYNLYAKLFNVRNDDGKVKPVEYTAGVPEDASYKVRSYWDESGYDPAEAGCYMPMDQFWIAVGWNAVRGYGNPVEEIDVPDWEGDPEIEDCRIVLAFNY